MVTIGFAILMICGEFDLSVGSVFAIMPMSVALMLNAGVPFWPAFAVGVLICAVIGFLNGFITLQLLHPELHHDARHALHGAIPDGRDVRRLPASAGGRQDPDGLFTGFIGGGLFRSSFVWFVLIAILASVMMKRTNFGNWIQRRAAFSRRRARWAFRSPGSSSSASSSARSWPGSPARCRCSACSRRSPIGESLELQAIAGSVIGGVALTGGVGTVFGAIVGALLIRVIDNGLVLSRIDANWFKFAIGALTVIAVVGNSWLRRSARRIKLEA